MGMEWVPRNTAVSDILWHCRGCLARVVIVSYERKWSGSLTQRRSDVVTTGRAILPAAPASPARFHRRRVHYLLKQRTLGLLTLDVNSKRSLAVIIQWYITCRFLPILVATHYYNNYHPSRPFYWQSSSVYAQHSYFKFCSKNYIYYNSEMFFFSNSLTG